MLATITSASTIPSTTGYNHDLPNSNTELATWSSNTISSFNGQVLSFEGSLGFDGFDLFRQARVALERGSIYGLVAPNGSGKTSLVRALPSLPNFPGSGSFRMEYLAADLLVDEEEEEEEAQMSRETENLKGDSAREYCMGRIQTRLQEIEDEIGRIEEQLETESNDSLEAMSNKLGELYEMKEDMELQASSQVDQMFDQLNFGDYPDQPFQQLSSGWKYKCQLISALLTQPDCLVIDEPSFLDTAATEWLVEQMQNLAHSLGITKQAIIVLISHKQALMEEVCDRILYLNPASKNLSVYNCGFREFQAAHADRVAHARKSKELATDAHDDAKHSLQSLRKQLNKREQNFKAITTEHHDKRFIKGKNKEAKQNADHSAASKLKRLKKKVAEVSEQEEELRENKVCPLKLEGADSSGNDRVLVEFNDVDFRFEGSRDMLLEYVNIQMTDKDRVLIQGRNGQGKSSLAKLILGQLEATHGDIRRNVPVTAHFHQDALRELIQYHGRTSAIDFLSTKNPNMTIEQIRTFVGRFGLKGNLALRPIRTLSAGQRVRLWLAREFSGSRKPSLLILDEVTENLDKETTDSLLQSLDDFPAAILAISHDSYFSENFHETQLWTIESGRVWVEYK